MSDSSSEEDMSRFQEAVDTTFINFVNNKKNVTFKTDSKPRSERYLQEATHYNDVKVSDEMQKRIGAKVSEIINKNLKFIEVQCNDIKTQNIKGGVKLFRDSEGFLSCDGVQDNFTKHHNNASKKLKKHRRLIDYELEETDEDAKVKSVAVTGDYILSKEETKCWKSRRKEKLFKYKGKNNSDVLIAVK
ncbi:uncharacterized protein [Battus philenor]|uniref:uncharacterized protein n=1 Tax=Battus philenor TaxID=42288 RepID=UPI0035CF3537